MENRKPLITPHSHPREIARMCSQFISPFRITDGNGFRLSSYDPGDTGPFRKNQKKTLMERLENGISYMGSLQEVFYASARHSLLIVLQAMDAAGKDSTIKHVMSGVNPQGCRVDSFKQPSHDELAHDFLWRTTQCLPKRGMIGIFNRSYYEEVLVTKVHPELLEEEGFSPGKADGKFWKDRYKSIRHMEEHLSRNKTHIIKFFLHISPEEQKKRFLDRLDIPEKNWKFSPSDIRERVFWDDYQKAFESMITHTSSSNAPWYIVPADNKWFARIVVLTAIVEKLASLRLEYPDPSAGEKENYPLYKKTLEEETTTKPSQGKKKSTTQSLRPGKKKK